MALTKRERRKLGVNRRAANRPPQPHTARKRRRWPLLAGARS